MNQFLRDRMIPKLKAFISRIQLILIELFFGFIKPLRSSAFPFKYSSRIWYVVHEVLQLVSGVSEVMNELEEYKTGAIKYDFVAVYTTSEKREIYQYRNLHVFPPFKPLKLVKHV